MKNIKKLLVVLCTSLFMPTPMISQNILRTIPDSVIVLTPRQAKITNLIFAEHYKWSKEVPLLNNQLNSYKNLINNYNKVDSLHIKEISLLKNQNNESIKNIKNLNKRLITSKIVGYSGGLLLFLLGFLIAK